jgi:protoporphyrinogen oxidase
VKQDAKHVVVIGAGPPGSPQAYELTKLGVKSVVLEKDGVVGGLARTEQFRGYHFDMGGHRFFTKAPEVNRMWQEVLGNEFLLPRPALTHLLQRKYFDYPLKPWNALSGLGPYQAVRLALSYLKWQVFPHSAEETFEQWVTNRFGRRLFLLFFRAYTEKVWGVPCNELKAEWAAQRIKDLSFRTAVMNMIMKPKRTIKTLIDAFHYPRLGPGMMWRAVAAEVHKRGCEGRSRRAGLAQSPRRNARHRRQRENDGERERKVSGSDFVSTMPITELAMKLEPAAPPEVVDAAKRLNYRSFLTVCPDHRQGAPVPRQLDLHPRPGRERRAHPELQELEPRHGRRPVEDRTRPRVLLRRGRRDVEHADDELIAMAKRELETIGLAVGADVEMGCVFRMAEGVSRVRLGLRRVPRSLEELHSAVRNLQTIGRNGLHRYNNQDHAMLTGMLAARNIALGEKNDVWAVNTDQDYHEEIVEEVGPNAAHIPARAGAPAPPSTPRARRPRAAASWCAKPPTATERGRASRP